MRQLKIVACREKVFALELSLPAEALFVQKIAKQHAETQEAFNEMCLVGLKAAQDFRATAAPRRYNSFVAWVVRQHILGLNNFAK